MGKSLCRGKKAKSCRRLRGCKVVTRKGKKHCKKNKTRKHKKSKKSHKKGGKHCYK